MTVTSQPIITRQRSRVAPWLDHYPQNVPANLDYPQIPAWGYLERTAAAYGDRAACRYYHQQLTYAELFASARKMAHVLVKSGVKPGDRVGVLLPNTPEMLIALNGIWMAGAVVVAVSPLMVTGEVSALLKTTECKTVIALDLLLPQLFDGEYQPEQVFVTTIADRLPFLQRLGYSAARIARLGIRSKARDPRCRNFAKELAQGNAIFQPIQSRSIDEAAFILPTGGTTAAPKAVVLSHRNLVSNAWQLHHWGGATMAEETVLAVVPFFHSYGLTTCAMTGTAMAATLVLQHRFVPRRVLKAIETDRPTVFHAVPAMLCQLNKLMRTSKRDHSSINYCMSGGAPLPASVAEEFSRHTGAIVVEGYGLSEASPVTHAGPLDGTARVGTIGLPLPDTEVRIVDPDTGYRPVGPGEVGEITVRGPQVMKGYWNDPEATNRAVRDGWLYTGDLAVCDDEGFFRIVDRKKDLIITSGFNVYPTDVERVIKQFPGIQDAAVVGVPDPDRGEVVKVVLVLERNHQFDRKVFINQCKAHLAKHKCPRLIEIADGDLPRNFLGKVLRKDLRN